MAALRGTVTVAAQRARGRTRALAALAGLSALALVAVGAIALVDGGGPAGRDLPGGSDADAALAVPGTGPGLTATAEAARPTALVPPEGDVAAPAATGDGAVAAGVGDTVALPGGELTPAPAGGPAGPEPGTSVTSTPSTVRSTAPSTVPSTTDDDHPAGRGRRPARRAGALARRGLSAG